MMSSDRRIAIGIIVLMIAFMVEMYFFALDIIYGGFKGGILFGVGLMFFAIFIMLAPWFLQIPSLLRNVWRVAIGEEEELL